MDVLFFPKSQPDPLIVGASDVGQGYNRPKNRRSGQGIKPWTHRKDPATRPGVQTLDRPKRLFVQSCMQLLHAIVHAIVKFHVRTKHVQMHERVPRGTCPLDDKRRPDQLNYGQWPDRFKNDE